MDYDVVIGLDVGKHTHHACGLDADGERVLDRPVDNTESALRAVFTELAGRGRVLVVVDQLHSIGALPVTVAQAMGIDSAYLPGLSMRRLADLHPGNAKTDARDAYVIANAALTVPHTLRTLDVPDQAQADLAMLLGYDDDLAAQVTASINRLRGLLVQIHPSLEKALGDNVSHVAVLHLLIKAGGPAGLRAMGKTRIDKQLAKHAPRMHARLTEAIWTGLNAQTVVVPGTTAAAKVLPGLAAQILQLRDQREQIAKDVEKVLDDHPLAEILTSMPGVGVKIAARLLAEIGGDVSAFPTAAHLAAFASLRPDPASRAYYDRKRAEGKKHNSALICLARRKTGVLFAMIRDHRSYTPSVPAAA